MIYTVIFVIEMDTYVVEDRIVSRWRLYYLPQTGETIPADMATPSPDERFHHCTYYPMLPMQLDWPGPVFESTSKTRACTH
jgi:hypothetical protein